MPPSFILLQCVPKSPCVLAHGFPRQRGKAEMDNGGPSPCALEVSDGHTLLRPPCCSHPVGQGSLALGTSQIQRRGRCGRQTDRQTGAEQSKPIQVSGTRSRVLLTVGPRGHLSVWVCLLCHRCTSAWGSLSVCAVGTCAPILAQKPAVPSWVTSCHWLSWAVSCVLAPFS